MATIRDLAALGPTDFVTRFGGPTTLPVQSLNVDLSTVTTAVTVHGAEQRDVLYGHILKQADPGRILYLAVPQPAFAALLEGPAGAMLIDEQPLHLIVFDPPTEVIVRWIP